VGATNAARVMGKGYGFLVYIIDFFKGYLPAALFSSYSGGSVFPYSYAAWVGVAAILGHIFTPLLKFKGGKGIAAGGGVVCAIHPQFFLISVGLFIVIFAATKMVSPASLCAVLSLLVMALWAKLPQDMLAFYALIFLIAVWTHRENIKRLMEGKENKFVSK
jgi:glycerol-3-phosphate acyltransferase PlsY